MILYHGSRTAGIKVLEPRMADHERPYIYFSTIDVVAAFYMCSAVERPYYWFPYGFSKAAPDVPIYNELYPNALYEVSKGVHGYIYKVSVSEEQVIPFKNIPCARLGLEPVKTDECIEIRDAYALFQEYADGGKLIIGRYEDKSEKELNWYYDMILDYIRSKQMYDSPNCSYALFVKEKFPFIWERYERER